MRFSANVKISDITGFTAGLLPGDIQVWEPALEDPDILVFSTHADDEILFLGSVLVTYGGELKKKVQVVYMCEFFSTASEREHEKLDGLWTAGIRNYPVNGPFSDTNGTTLSEAEKKYGYDNVAAFATENIRRFKPQVVVTQDFKGEYGHGGHIVLAEGVKRAVENSLNADYVPESSEKYGVWDVPKTYFHLYPENEIFISVREPLENMGGRIGLDILADAYRKHESQQWCWFYVSDDPEDPKAAQINCAEFGLYQTQVGPDTEGVNDMMEHVTSYEEQERIAAEAERARQEAAEKSRRELEELREENARREAEWQAEMTEAERQKQLAANRKKLISYSSAALLVAALALLFNNKKRS
jgi:LmbE family N-acetylglucosaminyl deacetylase